MSQQHTHTVLRPEHPRPSWVREQWINLNSPASGDTPWSCRFDPGQSGMEQGWADSTGFDMPVRVPFAIESSLSGIGHTDFVPVLWYHRRISVPRAWKDSRVILHFGAVDHAATVFIDGNATLDSAGPCLGRPPQGELWPRGIDRDAGAAADNTGGTAPFSVDITPWCTPGETHHLVVRVVDDIRSGTQPAGKQSRAGRSGGCHYTRTTGIWQTAWLEAIPREGSIDTIHIVPDTEKGLFYCTFDGHMMVPDARIHCVCTSEQGESTECESPYRRGVPVALPAPGKCLWSPQTPHLYSLTCTLRTGRRTIDTVHSYAGLREIHWDEDRLFLNGRPLFLRLILDQGFWPDGIWTAPSDDALRHDIEIAQAAGFNGARLHQKPVEERFHYWADRLGYLTWAEYADWSYDRDNDTGRATLVEEWTRLVVRDRNHPSIIAWTPFNETLRPKTPPAQVAYHDRLVREVYHLTRALDPTRPVVGCSGWRQVITDLYTAHNYQQNDKQLKKDLAPAPGAPVYEIFRDHQAHWDGQPYIMDEFGGTKLAAEGETGSPDGWKGNSPSWGYGEVAGRDAWVEKIRGLVDAVLAAPYMRGYCYTQLTDVEQEKNGLFTADRQSKADIARLRAVFGRDPDPRETQET